MKIADIPYVASLDGSSCALACHAMVASYFVPGTTVEEMIRLVDWQKGYVVWAFRFWHWLLERGVRITDFDLIDYEAWAREGTDGLRRSLPAKEFAWYRSATKDLDVLTTDIAGVMVHPGLTYHRRKPTWQDLVDAHGQGALCEVVLDACTLDGARGFSLHRVVVLDLREDGVVFHDPRPKKQGTAARVVPIQRFQEAWLEAVAAPELCLYER